ncbi:nucleoid-associated protein [Clostridium sp. MSJ-4]|uniref:Nucleoid-associated protein n=1 Tax=Clostridium simiarum TaxID=2841506 RepID=A0ABS6EYU3_9CLOT|nr:MULTISPECIES: nucleoid-associated protein [Clostridium]MBU5591389.1 nucleoid-associated protein [Clostridium simiarum]
MEYINDIHINEAIIHVLDNNGEEPLLNSFTLDLDEEIYKFLLKHMDKLLKDEELKYAFFNSGRNIVKEAAQEYLNGENDIVTVSKDIANQLFTLMNSNGNIPSCDLIVVSISTEHSPMLAILKMDYVKNYVHKIDFVEDNIGINIVSQTTGLPSSGQKIQKCAFIKPIREEDKFHLMVIDKQSKSKEKEEYGSNYFISNYLGCTLIDNERDMTKNLVKVTENWTRNNVKEDAYRAENIRTTIKKKLREDDIIDIEELSTDLFKEEPLAKENFIQFAEAHGLDKKVPIDKEWVEKKLKRIRLKIDKDIDLYINEEAYHDQDRFEIKRNGDGSINMIIKHVINYIEK